MASMGGHGQTKDMSLHKFNKIVHLP